MTELGLLDLIPRVAPELARPAHLHEWAGLLEGCLTGGGRGMVAVPIRHHKTVTTLYGIAWLLLHDPTIRIIGMCADHERATELAKMGRRICELVATASGVRIGPARGDNIILDWKNEHGGGVVWMSAEQSKLGRDVDVLICDDPITEQTAGDPVVRDAVDAAIAHYTMRAGRIGRRGSVMIVMSRWHPDDPIGRRLLRKAADWTYVAHPAIIDLDLPTERAFAPEVMTLEELRKRRAEKREEDPSERLWWAQFMSDPRVQVDARFKQPMRYETAPCWPGFRYGIGVDLAYTPGAGSDWFACVVVKFYGSIAYVIDVVREKADFNTLENIIRNRWDRYGRCPIYSYVSGPEIGAVRYFTSRGIPIEGLRARYNKGVRAQKTTDFWNSGKIQLPMSEPWVAGFLSRVLLFTGSEKARDDDEVDAMVSVIDGMLGSGVGGTPTVFGKPRM